MITIGSQKIETNVILAPMSGCTDLSFRLVAREHGAGFCFFEMVDSHSVIYNRRRTMAMLKTVPEDEPIALQLLGSDPDIMLRSARELLSQMSVSFIDINAACPAPKVAKKKAGSYLLKDRENLCSIIKKLAVSLDIPITVKMRLAHETETVQEVASLAKDCERSGASAIFVHGRTRLQRYAGEVDYGAIRAIKDSVKIPVIGSGNVLSPEMAKRMFDRTACDGILAARGALGNPWIFRAIKDHLDGAPPQPEPDPCLKKSVLKRHLSYIDRHVDCSHPGKVGIMRKVALWYMKSFPSAKRIREQVSLVRDYEKMLKLIDSIEYGPSLSLDMAAKESIR